ncbi:hypothetical protein KK062_27365 [Fulvivirgaceae bacterium PWU5]|uniref:Uncharacterized protein n=1 Tax=Dawidia cretensis TaxID=2782350 RepID=A0AAP2E508_9BACT|nr:hypothetical protein [Dawidia cretensis]MBT1711992.1 hypothetical protein [Dawidia cretensis]
MNAIVEVFSIVQAMSKSEKRYFKMVSELQKGEKSYLTLFTILEKHTMPDDDLANEVRKSFPGQTVEPARKHLYRVLMKSLRQFDTEKDVETRLSNLLQDSRLLYNRGLLKLSFDQLEKTKTLALQREKFMYYVLAARQELQYLVRSHFEGLDEFELLEKQKRITELLEQQTKIEQHSTLYEILLLRYWRNGMVRSQQEATRLNDLLLEEYQLLNGPGRKPFELQQLHLHFQSIYFQMTGNPEGSLPVFYDLDALFQQNHELWKGAPLYYFHLLDGVLYDLRQMQRYEDMQFFLQRLQSLHEEGGGLNVVLTYKTLEHELNVFADRRLFDEGLMHMKTFEERWQREASQLPLHMHAQLLFAGARILVGVKDYSAALKLINIALNQLTSAMSQAQQSMFQILNLMVNTLLNNVDYLQYALRAAERKLKSDRKLFGVEQLMLSFLKKWIAARSFPEFNDQLHALQQNPFERQLINELALAEWYDRVKPLSSFGAKK